MVAHWLLTLVAAPYFLPPRDSLGTAIAAALLLGPIDLTSVGALGRGLDVFRWAAVGLAVVVGLAALVAIFLQNERYRPLSQITYRLSSTLGKGEVLLTPAVIVSAAGFYQTNLVWLIAILGFWVFVATTRPVELALRIWLFLRDFGVVNVSSEAVGRVLRVDDPNVVRVALKDGASWTPENVYVGTLSDGHTSYLLPLFSQVQNEEMIGTGLRCFVEGDDAPKPVNPLGTVYPVQSDGLRRRLATSLSGDEAATSLIGIVVEGSSISSLRFQVVSAETLEEGMVIFAPIRGRRIYYQILDAATGEENFQQNPFGVHIATAAQLGAYDPKKGFEKFPWLPNMNQPLFLASEQDAPSLELAENEFSIGEIPFTSFGVPVVLDDLVEYHTAVLGITGTGKTELALDLIRNALDRGTKVFCVDFTGEYKHRLADHAPLEIGLSVEEGSRLEKLLFAVETGTFGAKQERADLQKFLDEIRPQVAEKIETFLTDPDRKLGIFELAEITNTKATLRTTEMYLSEIMDWARKHRRAERIMIVLEEAHTIVPEPYGSGFDSDTQWVVSRIGQIALQGRKYGVGLLVISQRTALVSKTILSQCNTYFTHALVDKTSLDYLAGVYSGEHVRAIPNLRFLEFLAYGKAVKSDRPLLARRQFDEAKAVASRELDARKAESTTGTQEST